MNWEAVNRSMTQVEDAIASTMPQWVAPLPWALLGGAVAAGLLYLAFLLLRLAAPRTAAILATTAKETLSQPLFFIVLSLGAFLLVIFVFVPYNTFGEDIKMLEDSSVTLITVLAIILALWMASVSIAEEIEGRTALTLLSKPVGRRQFILGKFLGVLTPTVVLFLVLGVLLLCVISYKVPYDARETSQEPPSAQMCRLEMFKIVPALGLALLQVMMLTAISVAISTRLTMLANITICATIYILGHLVPAIAQSAEATEQVPLVGFVATLLGTVLPVLQHFDPQAAIAKGEAVPLSYLPWAALYAALYSGLALLLALFLFEDRDLA